MQDIILMQIGSDHICVFVATSTLNLVKIEDEMRSIPIQPTTSIFLL